MILKVDYKAIDNIKDREIRQRDSLPRHTLDWYTYNNRVELIAEIEQQFHAIPVFPVEADGTVAIQSIPESTSDKDKADDENATINA